MEVVAAPSSGAPFHDHDVREWSRIDSITGALERARLETDHWSANTVNSSHKYGKVSEYSLWFSYRECSVYLLGKCIFFTTTIHNTRLRINNELFFFKYYVVFCSHLHNVVYL